MPRDGYWAVVQVRTNTEHAARLNIMRLGLETYAPRIKHRGRIAFLFPGYIFVRIINQFYQVRWSPGVIRILLAGDVPAPVPDDFLTDLRKRERRGFIQLPLPFKTGQRVRITKGSFTGHIGVYAGMSGKAREAVLLELMGRTVQIEMRTGNLNLVG